MIKEEVRERIDTYLQNLIKELRTELADKTKASVIQCSDVNDMDSHSHQFQTLKDEKYVNDRLNQAIKEQGYFQKMPSIKVDIVKEGALVNIKNFYLYVGIVTPVISSDEMDIIGISTSAPIYKTLVSQSVGFKFKFNGIDCVIKSIQ